MNWEQLRGSPEPVDVALLVEGTYPFVRGGVSSWVHRLIESLPELTLSVVFLGGRHSDHGPPVYPALPNVRSLQRAYLFEPLLRHRNDRPLVITEHGIYTKERKIDLASAEYIAGDHDPRATGFGRRLWMRFFEGLGRIAYASADHIIALNEGSRRRQIQDGADPVRTRVIPNGVDIRRFAAIRATRPCAPAPVLGFLGRVVPIKHVKCFIRAMKSVIARHPEARGCIIGPTSEDPGYARECAQLAAAIGLDGHLTFTGYRPAEEVLPELGLLVLTSISEGLPLVVLEAFASGLPVLTTDVGACRELVEGRTLDDCEQGAAGAVVPFADPDAVAHVALALLGDPARWRAAQQAAIRRVETHYTEARVFDAYRRIYQEAHTWHA